MQQKILEMKGASLIKKLRKCTFPSNQINMIYNSSIMMNRKYLKFAEITNHVRQKTSEKNVKS